MKKISVSSKKEEDQKNIQKHLTGSFVNGLRINVEMKDDKIHENIKIIRFCKGPRGYIIASSADGKEVSFYFRHIK